MIHHVAFDTRTVDACSGTMDEIVHTLEALSRKFTVQWLRQGRYLDHFQPKFRVPFAPRDQVRLSSWDVWKAKRIASDVESTEANCWHERKTASYLDFLTHLAVSEPALDCPRESPIPMLMTGSQPTSGLTSL